MPRLLVLALLCACVTPGPRPPPPTSYDFGLGAPPLAVERPFAGPLVVEDVAAPDWISGEGIVYRLAYENAARPATYSQSRWVAPPAELLSQRLLQRLANVATGGVVRHASGVTAAYLLRVELEEFSQVFDAPGHSRALVRLRASLLDEQGALLAQETFGAERPAPPDAAGAATSLRETTDVVIERIAAWLVDGIAAREHGDAEQARRGARSD